MRTALRMYNDLQRKGYNPGLSKDVCISLFEDIVRFLNPDEEVVVPFIGKYEQKWRTGAVTNKRIILITGNSGFLNRKVHASFISHSELLSIEYGFYQKSGKHTMNIIKRDNQRFIIEINKDFVEHLTHTIGNTVIDILKGPKKTKGNISIAKEIERFKKLLDEGAITQEEFDKQKTKLLDA